MNKVLDYCTFKQKLAKVLLHCMNWGYDIKGDTDFDKKIIMKLKLQNNNDVLRLRSCIDLIEDTEYAIIHFSKFGIQKYCRKGHGDFGEMSMKLYGILNAVYLQTWAIIELIETCRFPDKTNYIVEFMGLEIIEMRNVVGSHTVNFKQQENGNHGKFKKNFFRIAQSSITPKCDRLIAVDGFDGHKEFNLYESMITYNYTSERILYQIVEKYLISLFGKASVKPKEIFEHHEIECCTPYNYRRLYLNDKARKRFYKSLEKEFERLHGKNWRKVIDNKFAEYLREGSDPNSIL